MEGKRVMFRTVETHVDRVRAMCWNENSLGAGEQFGRNLQPSIFTNSKFFCLKKNSVDHCKLHVCLLSSQRPRVALYFESVKPRPLQCACVLIPWLSCCVFNRDKEGNVVNQMAP